LIRKGEVALSVFADFSKLFDTVKYPTLVKQLHDLGFLNCFISLIDDYLNVRYQYVQVNDKTSKQLLVEGSTREYS